MASEMLEKVLKAEKQSESSIAAARVQASDIIAAAQAQATKAIEECAAQCAKNSAAATLAFAEKCKETEKLESGKDTAAQQEMLAGASGSRAKAAHAVREMIFKAR